ncbi:MULTISPECIES: methyl-accepting chemotaxis protein [Vibrio]|uniref:methyl-accepting chemotaxis protein n=1 Tax=Vibrio TaxID=662 RepID=UPI000C167F70|nr:MULTISPECIES: methyl-accepting chemotaxis protein [Vibrio]NNN45229.1 methyl-accepting chemotaxis protein [Vibrio sp. 1-1(7)]NNN72602.1 methyl-accepting chemotaxis protein [Vibrio sp. 12-2(3-a)]
MNSIRYKSMLLLIIISLVVMTFVFSGSYFLAKNYLVNQLEQDINDTNQTLSVVLKEPLFSYDTQLIDNITHSFVNNPYLYQVKAFDHRDNLIGEAKSNELAPAISELKSFTLNILWEDGQKIGSLVIDYRLDANSAILSTIKKMFLLIAILLLFSLQLINWGVLSKLVIAPLTQVTAALSKIAQGEGDLTSRLTIRHHDEVGQLANEFNTFISNLHALVTRIIASTTELTLCAEKIRTNSEQNSHETQQQLREIEQVATALSEMASTSHEVSLNANNTADKTRSCNELAEQGNHVVQQTVSAIHKLGDEINATSSTIIELKEKSDYISTVLEVIKGVADQTNLLALNAAIEAARAGEQGRGFAVVADEVRALALRTHHSTEEIEQIIHDLQASSENANSQMHGTSITLSQTVSESEQTTLALNNIIKHINDINDMNTQIAAATEEQTTVASDISEKINTINESTTSVTNNVAGVRLLSEQLDELCQHIRQDLSKFKV